MKVVEQLVPDRLQKLLNKRSRYRDMQKLGAKQVLNFRVNTNRNTAVKAAGR